MQERCPGDIVVRSASATITGNTVNDASKYGIYVSAAAIISGNMVNNAPSGIYVVAPAKVTSNQIFNSSSSGITLSSAGIPFPSTTSNGATVTNNTLTRTEVGIDFQCHTATATGNTINGATTGLNQVLTFPGANSFFNVDTLTTGGC
jgi:Right handed beta helix region